MVALYRQAQSDTCIWLHYDDSDCWIVHSPASGQTHLLTASAYRLWTLIPETGISVTELIARLGAEIGHDDGMLASTVEDTLAVMDGAGLIEPVRP